MPLVPKLAWYSRAGDDTFQNNHANAIIFATDNHNPMVGQTVGATILAPGTGYPDHHHVPKETYLVATAGWFKMMRKIGNIDHLGRLGTTPHTLTTQCKQIQTPPWSPFGP